MSKAGTKAANQALHLVFGGELTSLDGHIFKNPADVDVVGIFPTYNDAHRAWKAAAQRTVDNAMMRYFVIDLGGSMADAIDPAAHATTGD